MSEPNIISERLSKRNKLSNREYKTHEYGSDDLVYTLEPESNK
jgi:hypothetical protein